MVQTILKQSEMIAKIFAWISGFLLVGTAVMISVEVILRKVFSVSMGGADEISGYAMAISCSWSFAYALFRKAHIRIDVIYVKLPRTVRYALDICALALFATYMVVLTYFSFFVFQTSFIKSSTANTPLHTPLWVPQFIWLFGLLAFTIAILIILLGTIYNMLRKNYSASLALSGVSTLEEEIEEETVGSRQLEAVSAGGSK
jgi:TRAP-type C4-dicarboxylate transport system permease small subunit